MKKPTKKQIKKDKLISVDLVIVWKSDGLLEDVQHTLQTRAILSKIEKDKGILGQMVRNPSWPRK